MTRNELKLLAKEKNINIKFGRCPNMKKEIWKQYSNILVSNYGNIKNIKTNESAEFYVNNNRAFVKTSEGKKYVTFLVYDLFIGLNRENLEVHHIDQNSLNNRADNLVAVSKSIHCKLHFLPKTKHLKPRFSKRFISALKTTQNIVYYSKDQRDEVINYIRDFLSPVYNIIENKISL